MIEEILGKNAGALMKLFELIEGKEVKTKVNLDGVEFKVGKTSIVLNGEVEFSLVRKKK
ncbi:MAG: hypothetical protein ABIH52_02990 [Candidatus Aenigmatarchaeota archaeon]|nr:hypothetical protein [Nanoarchaeota archaeon]